MGATPGSEYNLWLGAESADAVFSDLILDLTQYSQPATLPFAPHATLLSSSIIGASTSLDQIKKAVTKVANDLSIERVVCKFDRLEAGQTFYQCVYIRLDKDGSEGLLELHKALRIEFGDNTDIQGASYYPHLSLVYGDLPQAEREKIIQQLYAKKQAVTLENGKDQVQGFTEVEVRNIQIVRTVGQSDEWEIVASIPLGSKAVTHEDL